MIRPFLTAAAASLGLFSAASAALPSPSRFPNTPSAMAELRCTEGAALVNAEWSYCDASIVSANSPDEVTGISPRIDAPDFEQAPWTMISPDSLEDRRTRGGLSMGWYRLKLTVPREIGDFATRGSIVFLHLVVDDYAEVWVNGKHPLTLGQAGAHSIAGWNAPNRVLVTDDASPGESFDIAILAANGPLGAPPSNKVWIRSAAIEFYSPERLRTSEVLPLNVVRFDDRIDQILPRHATIERLATGFTFIEGPVWVNSTAASPGYLLFSEPNSNVIHRFTPIAGGITGELAIFRLASGYSGADVGRYRQAGSNGLALDLEGRLTICEHGNRRVTRLEPKGQLSVLADRFEGKRLNSPNDLVYRSDGALFFTDPPFGFPGFHDDPAREIAFFGVFMLKNGEIREIVTDLRGPNGICLSPDEQYLYVGNWDENHKVVMRYRLGSDGSVSRGEVFADLNSEPGEEAIDGVKTDRAGNIYISGPGGLWIYGPEGTRLALVQTPELAANFCFGGDDGQSLYLAARTSLYRVNVLTGQPRDARGAAQGP